MCLQKITAFFLVAIFLLTGICGFAAGNDNMNIAKNNALFPEMEIYDSRNGKMISEKQFLAEIEKNNAVYILEEHDNAVHHLLQAKIAKFLGKNNKDFAIGFEMFNKNTDEQKYLDLYKESKISEKEFIESAWKWGFDFALYKPILDLIGINHCKGVALNIPMSATQMISQKISRDGFESLPEKAKLLFPKDGFKIFCDCPNGQYHNAIMRGLESMKMMGIVTPEMEKRFHISQWVMNEIMAASIMEYFENQDLKTTKMAVMLGVLHGIYDKGIISSVKERNPNLKQITVFALNYSDIEGNIPEEKLADFILIYR